MMLHTIYICMMMSLYIIHDTISACCVHGQVAPITLNGASLASYDFWAVGKNCCSDQMADFRCGAFKGLGAKGGVRVTDDVDRDFYRP